MKLHRIETYNLNSLYGEQSVDLDVDLGNASLFLIHGPTGSGKSTLMDAVSLALFGRTPRLTAERGNDDAKPYRVMSRGTGQCRATVVFSKLEGLKQWRHELVDHPVDLQSSAHRGDGREEAPDHVWKEIPPPVRWLRPLLGGRTQPATGAAAAAARPEQELTSQNSRGKKCTLRTRSNRSANHRTPPAIAAERANKS